MSLTPGARLGPYEIVAPLGAGHSVEVVEAVALPLVVRTVCRVLDLERDADRIAAFGLSVWGDHLGRRDGTAFHAYLDELIDRAMEGRAGRVLDTLANPGPAGRPLVWEELIGIASLLLAAGRDTVIGLVAGIGWALTVRPDLLPVLGAVGSKPT